jgi:hypothetical protein
MGLVQLLTDPGAFKFYWENQMNDTALGLQNPRAIPFGHDRPNGGSSKQPYIQIGIPGNSGNPITYQPSQFNFDPIQGFSFTAGNLLQYIKSGINTNIRYNSQDWGPDFLTRGNLYGLLRASDDVKRLTKYFIDDRSISGYLFVTKQNLLSQVGVKTEASVGLNGGIYSPTSTVAQAGVSLIGFHLNKQGLDPTGLVPGLSIKDYQTAIIENPNNRLIELTRDITLGDSRQLGNFTYNPGKNDILLSYKGGPDSTLGLGNTNIRFATNNKNTPLKSLTTPASQNNLNSTLFATWDKKALAQQSQSLDGSPQILEDFRQKLNPTGDNQNKFLSLAPNYKTYNVEDRFNLGNPGSRGNRSNYNKGKIINNSVTTTDKITAYPLYKSGTESKYPGLGGDDTTEELRDIIPFFISILNNELQVGGPYKKFIHFRAFIDSFSDSYNADWSSINYMGRAEKFYKYKGFDRKINMSFTVVAQSKPEIEAMYDKLNFLASSLSPEYLDSYSSGYMAGNIAYLTLGDYVSDQPGIITSLTYDIPEEATWEIGIDEIGNDADKKTTRQLPHLIRVTGFQFTPIHKFRPEKWSFENDALGTDSTKLLNVGNQRYIDQTRPGISYDQDQVSIQSNQQADILTT